ncbi:MAG: SAM-dependent methyltransferase [Thaumarchaeota archaeon]|jgi:predicted RNA methylase|nr:SAM-dependent methyltransferase [Candidatus Geocrenenecus arthurdayi]
MRREGRRLLPFVPSPRDVVEKMLSIADPKPDELLVDLGSGDGRIILSAAKDYRCWALGIEKNENLVELTRKKIASMGLDKATVLRGDLYSYDFSEADVLTLYLLPEVLEILVPKFKKMKKGARIVSHDYMIPGLSPSEIYELRSMETSRPHRIYVYLVK